METKLNDNEVKEVARMQELIDRYELAIRSMFLVVKHNSNINYPLIGSTPFDKELNHIWRWIKERKANRTIWHDASEEPKMEKGDCILAEYKEGWCDVLNVIGDGILFSALANDNEYLKNIKRWCYINELKDKE